MNAGNARPSEIFGRVAWDRIALHLRIHPNMKFLAACFVFFVAAAIADTPQDHIHHVSGSVMPFDMGKTMHVFVMNERGGIQKVVARDAADADQVALIRKHLRHEFDNFRQGNFADPARLHGAEMPGLAQLQTAGKKIRVTYADLPDGAALTFQTIDLHVLTAVHRWFGAQLSEHGADARAE